MMVTIKIANMNCGSCAKSVTAALRGAWPDVQPAVDLKQHTITVATDNAAPLIEVLVATGWQASVV